MAYKEFDGKFVPTGATKVGSTAFDNVFDGLQAELEERMEAAGLNGIESGCALSISTTNISIATGVLWVEGRRFEPAPSTIAFTAGDGNNTYYLYVDPTDTGSPYKKSTSDPGAGYLVLGTVAWNGSDTLSSLVDYSVTGMEAWEFHAQVVGAVSADTIGFCILPFNVWIESVSASLENCGTAAGPSYIDVHGGAGGSEATIFTTQSRRPTIAHDGTDGAVYTSGVPDGTRKFTAGQKLLVIVDAASTNAADLAVVVKGRRYN
jgi:hypothetical protein